jgi:chemotaxis protein MotA
MDLATGIGLLFGFIVVLALILMGGDLGTFLDYHAVIVIFGGSAAATLIRFPLSSIAHGLPLGAKYAFTMRRLTQLELVDEIARLAEVARKAGPLGLEKEEVEDPFLAKGVRYVADGYDAAFIRDAMERERETFFMHLDEGQKIYRAIGDCAPAFGMVGTLIGMVQMFANMSDPSKLGPFMAIALLATLYGAVLANLVCLPIADKLQVKLHDEETNRTLIIDGVLMIREAKSPAIVREMLVAYLPEKHHPAPEAVPA